MAEVERLMWASVIRIAVEPPDGLDGQFCLGEYFRELRERFDNGFDAANSISANPEELTPPAGIFVVARLNGRAVGCGALKVKRQKVAEIKRMWVSPEVRGLGVGRRLLEHSKIVRERFVLGPCVLKQTGISKKHSSCIVAPATSRSPRSTTSRTPTTGSKRRT